MKPDVRGPVAEVLGSLSRPKEKVLQAFEEQTFSIKGRHPRSSASEDPCHQPILTDRSALSSPNLPASP